MWMSACEDLFWCHSAVEMHPLSVRSGQGRMEMTFSSPSANPTGSTPAGNSTRNQEAEPPAPVVSSEDRQRTTIVSLFFFSTSFQGAALSQRLLCYSWASILRVWMGIDHRPERGWHFCPLHRPLWPHVRHVDNRISTRSQAFQQMS